MTPHNTSQEELLKELQTSAAGLSSQEAQQRLERYGENKLAEKRRRQISSGFWTSLRM